MTKTQEDQLIDIYLSEYEKIKQEQIQRMGFRDNLIYANLIAITGIVSIVADDVARMPVILVLPMICITLGWTYLVNDEKISALGRYIRITFSERVRELLKSADTEIFGWETAHRSDKRRVSRKIIQFFIDEFVFVLPGFIAITIFWLNASNTFSLLKWIAGAEVILLLILGIQIFIYADFKKGK